MNRIVKGIGALMGTGALAVGAMVGWAFWSSGAVLAQTFETHSVEFPVPWPLSEAELDALRAEKLAEIAAAAAANGDGQADANVDAAEPLEGNADPIAEPAPDPLAGVDLEALAMERAVARGAHLVNARFGCVECHGADFSGGEMVDDPAMGTWRGPNLTLGSGGVTSDYTAADWDRIVRHGVRSDGTGAIMPSEDFQRMSDVELSDVVAYVRSFPAIDNTEPERSFGPISTMLLATGALPLSAQSIGHHGEHAEMPPEAADNVEYGQHVGQMCTGCHREELNGGPIAVGPPDWAPASNLTPHTDGLEGWTFEQFDVLMREGKRSDGSMVVNPMTKIPPYTKNLSEIEMRALWTFLQSKEPLPTGE